MLATVHWLVLWNLLSMSSSILDDHGVNRFLRSRLECGGKQCPVLTCYFFHNQLFVSRNIVLTAGTCTSTCISEQKFDVWGLYSPWAKVNKERKKERCNCLWATHIIFIANTRTWLRENLTSNRNEEYMEITIVSPCSSGWHNLLFFIQNVSCPIYPLISKGMQVLEGFEKIHDQWTLCCQDNPVCLLQSFIFKEQGYIEMFGALQPIAS